MGMKIQVSVSVSRFSIDVNNEFSVVSRELGCQGTISDNCFCVQWWKQCDGRWSLMRHGRMILRSSWWYKNFRQHSISSISGEWGLSWYLDTWIWYLDFHSHHDKNHKISTAATLLHRATNLPNTDTGRNKEIKRVYTALESNGYPVNLVADTERKKRVPPPVPTPEELVGMFFKWVDHRIHVDSRPFRTSKALQNH